MNTEEQTRESVDAKLESYDDLYQHGNDFLKQQRWGEAATVFQRSIELKPDFSWSSHSLGDAIHFSWGRHPARLPVRSRFWSRFEPVPRKMDGIS